MNNSKKMESSIMRLLMETEWRRMELIN